MTSNIKLHLPHVYITYLIGRKVKVDVQGRAVLRINK
jgi:hypothetical protein